MKKPSLFQIGHELGIECCLSSKNELQAEETNSSRWSLLDWYVLVHNINLLSQNGQAFRPKNDYQNCSSLLRKSGDRTGSRISFIFVSQKA